LPDLTPWISFAAVPAEITITQVLALLGIRPRSDHASQQRGARSWHSSGRGAGRWFSVNTTTHTFHCFKGGPSGNALDLWASTTRLSIHTFAIDLRQRLNIPLPILPSPITANSEEEP
jgi:hypothetical protein